MTTWSGFVNHLRIGYDVWTDGYDTWTPSINVYIQVHIQVDSTWNFNDSQTVVLFGATGASWTFQNTMGKNGIWSSPVAVIGGQGQSYGGGPQYNLGARLDGNYLGAGPEIYFSYVLPARPPRLPAPPGVPFYKSVAATSAFVDFAGSPDNGGSAINLYAYHISTDPNFGAYTYVEGPSTASGLSPGTTYYTRSYARNGVGWSGPSGVSSFKTTPFATSTPSVTDVAPDAATVNWAASSDATPTGYQLQVARDSGFTDSLQSFESATWGTSRRVTGLAPATRHYTRVRSKTSTGYGSWSVATSFETLSGAKYRKNGAWVDAPVFVLVAGQWKVAKVYKRVNGAWVL